MKITNRDLVNGFNWCMSTADKDVSYTAAFLIAANIEAMKPLAKCFEEQRAKIIKEHSKKDIRGCIIYDENNNPVLENEESADKITEELNKLADCEIDVAINPISTKEMEGLSIPFNQMMLIKFLFAA